MRILKIISILYRISLFISIFFDEKNIQNKREKKQNKKLNCESLACTLCRNACCSAMNALILLLTSSTTFLVDFLTALQLDKHSHSYVSISVNSMLDALWMFSSAFSLAMSTFLRKESQCASIVNSDSMDILVSSAVESPMCPRHDLNLAIEL